MESTKEKNSNLVLEQVEKIFEQGNNHVRAVDNISIDIHEGEFLTLLGPSGCGKTTTLRLIAGFEFPTHGRILLDGDDIANLPPNKRPMAMVFQSYALFPHLNVFENVAYGLRLRKQPEKVIRDSVEIVLHMMNLAGLEKRTPNQLSGGQQQRVALARAIVTKPRVLLFDEPLSNLDAKLRAQMRIELRHLQQRMGITSIYVTHDQTEAMSLSDRIVVMNKGRVEQLGSPIDIYRRPDSLFVADFIGRANFIETKILSREDKITCTAEALGQKIRVPSHRFLQRGQPAYLVVRPEGVHYTRVEGDKANGRIKTSIYLGSSVETEIEADKFTLVAVDNDPAVDHILSDGSSVRVSFDPARCYLLPYEKQLPETMVPKNSE
ncbi:MAG: ABC transporter ATP-binding protein [Chloroflexi bacterium]|jgi:iron(III) transport system ATP-binding protein|nr:ABC transporter ATP-binding protein [Chloroflexota bacterium]